LDWKELKRWSFGALKLKPEEFWSLTLFELNDMLDAFNHEEKRQDDMLNQRIAWQTSHIMNASGNFKKRIKPEDLYKPMAHKEAEEEKQNIVERFETPQQKEDYLKNLMKKFGKETDGS
jgi:hypothetical protein